MKNIVIAALLSVLGVAASAKIPAPVLDDAGKAKAAETAAKTAWSAKVDGFQLCRAQDRVAAYAAKAAKAAKDSKPAKPVKETPACVDPGAFVSASAGASVPATAAGAAKPAGSVTPGASAKKS